MVKINPKQQTCKCGYNFIPSNFFKLRLLLFGDVSVRCPRCNSKLSFRLISHVVKVNTEKCLDERIWENG